MSLLAEDKSDKVLADQVRAAVINLEKTIKEACDQGLLVDLDVKRKNEFYAPPSGGWLEIKPSISRPNL